MMTYMSALLIPDGVPKTKFGGSPSLGFLKNCWSHKTRGLSSEDFIKSNCSHGCNIDMGRSHLFGTLRNKCVDTIQNIVDNCSRSHTGSGHYRVIWT